MELRHLRYFLAAADAGNFRRAAEILHITQPPLSRTIHQLEEELGSTLFERSRSGVKLTTAGDLLLVEARRLVDQSDALVSRFRSTHKAKDGDINIAYVGSIVVETVPNIIRAFQQTDYEVSVKLHSMNKVEQLQALKAGTIDIGFSRSFPESSEIVIETILEEPLCIALSDRDERAEHSSLTLEDVQHDTLISFPVAPRPSFPDIVIEQFQACGILPADHVIVDDLISCLGLVAAGTGLAVVPYSATRFAISGISYIPLDGDRAKCHQRIAYRKNERSPGLLAFIGVCRRASELVT